MNADQPFDRDATQEHGSPKREYRRPELRELGTLTELTHATPDNGPGADSSGYATS